MLNTNTQIKYRVVLDGRTLSEHTNKVLAEAQIFSLGEDARTKAKIVPVMEDGRQFLLG
jgi:hypothetical protein